MIIRSVRHRGLQRLIDDNNPRYLPLELVQRIRSVLTALMLADDIGNFLIGTPPGWRATAYLVDEKPSGAHRFPGTGGLLS